MTASVQASFPVMGTVASICIAAADVDRCGRKDVEAAIADARVLLETLDQRFSHFRSDSDISRYALGQPVDDAALREIAYVLAECARLEAESGGVFTARRPVDGRLDTAGFVKGHAIQRAADLMVDRGIDHFIVGVGGDVQCRGRADIDRPWRVALQDPRRNAAVVALVDATDLAVATSGGSQRGAHVWSLRWQGECGDADAPVASFTVMGPLIEEADAFATIGFAMGDAGIAWVARHEGYRSVLVRGDGRMLSDAPLLSAA